MCAVISYTNFVIILAWSEETILNYGGKLLIFLILNSY